MILIKSMEGGGGMVTNFFINGIRIRPEGDHWRLEKDGYMMRCDTGELNAAIPEFLEWIGERSLSAVS